MSAKKTHSIGDFSDNKQHSNYVERIQHGFRFLQNDIMLLDSKSLHFILAKDMNHDNVCSIDTVWTKTQQMKKLCFAKEMHQTLHAL